ncbi:MAG: hypothetical protein ACRDTC_00775 [Pseudonocardiaceae bacterium]
MESKEDTGPVQAILNFLIRIDRLQPLSVDLARHVHEVLIERLPDIAPSNHAGVDSSAAAQNMAKTCGTLMTRHLSTVEINVTIAEAFAKNDQHQVGGRVSRLKDRTDCPPQIVTYIVNELQE